MRKVLSFVLVLALVLGSFSFAFGLTDIDESANKEAIQVCNDLGIIDGYPDGTFQGDKAVNRAEFAAMITRALGVPDSALAGYATTSFKDVAGYGWAVPYLAFCESKGIMLGDGMGNAMPGRTISVNEAITMALRAVGYTENSAMLVGSWPANYVTLGQQQGLYTDLATATTIDRENAAQVIYNALTVDLVTVNADGQTNVVANAAKDTILEAYHNCNTALNEVLGDTYAYGNSLINVGKRLGAYGTAYTNDDRDLVAFTADSVELTGKVNSDNKFVVGDTKYDLSRVTGSAVRFENGVASTVAVNFAGALAADTLAITGAAVDTDDGETLTLNVDVSGKYIDEIYSVVTWEADDADLAASDVQDDIADGDLLASTFDLDDNDDIISTGFVLLGVAALADIEEDNVVAIYNGGGLIRMVTVGTEVVTGTVEETGSTYVIINGTKYSQSDVLGAAALPALDAEGTFYLDYNGDIYDYVATTPTPDSYGVITASDFTAGTWGDQQIVKMFNSDEKSVTLDLIDADDMTWTNTGAAINETAIVTGSLIAYALDADGNIEAIDGNTGYVTTGAVDKLKSTKILTTALGDVDVSSDVVVYAYDAAGDLSVVSIDDVKLNTAFATNTAIGGVTYGFQFALNDDNDEVLAMLVSEAYLSDSTEDGTFAVINTVTKVVVGDDTVAKYVGFVDGVAVTYMATDDSDYAAVEAARAAATITLYEFDTTATDKVDAATPVNTLFATTGNNATKVTAAAVVTKAGVSSDGMTITSNTGDKFAVASDAVVYKFDAANKTYSVSTIKSIKAGYEVTLYDTKEGTNSNNGVATVVIFAE